MSGTVVAHNDWQSRTEVSADALLNHWLDQAQLRLRRELAWCWYQRTGQGDPQLGVLPPTDDALREGAHWSFNLPRRAWFFDSDTVARQLSLRIEEAEPQPAATAPGSFGWVCERLQLQAAERFVLALALAHRLDSALGPVCASCMNDLTRPFPTLSLAQRLWDEPNEIVSVAAPTHRLYRSGLLHWQGDTGLDWLQPLEPGRLVLETLLRPDGELPHGLRSPVPGDADRLPDEPLWQARLQLDGAAARLIPLSGNPNADFELWAARMAVLAGRPVISVTPSLLREPGVTALGTWAWLRGVDLLLPVTDPDGLLADLIRDIPRDLPLRWYLPLVDGQTLQPPERDFTTPPFEIPAVDFHHRLELFERGLGHRGREMAATLEECARRFRLPEHSVTRLARELAHQPGLTPALLVAACRAETGGELRQLTQRVAPRFTLDQLVLPAGQRAQFDELRRAARALTEVHYRWGTARAWNEGGLAVLFHGPPGTGKTMAAEVLANDLGLEMYRIDLSQVVSKYIGETEKNLRRIFDAADASDCVLFFDEADAIFGKRTEVKDAHDRYANIEISYLLERMERFKGVAILASNRRKDLDEAFLRRLRYSLAFPIPDQAQREAIWRAGFPPAVDTGDIDFRFLARQFAFSGGHIKSVIFNACLQAAAAPQGEPARGKVGRPSMVQVLLQVKRELQKLDRSSGVEQFGPYAEQMQRQGDRP